MAITGHKSEQSISDYNQMDTTDHLKISNVLSGKTHYEAPPHQTETPPQRDQTRFSEHSHQFSAPVVIQHCNLYFGSSSTASATTYSVKQSSTKRRRMVIDSDSD